MSDAEAGHTPLTDASVRAMKPRKSRRDVRDGHTRGLILTVLPSGRKQWAVRYRLHGKQRRLVLGDFPALTLAKARRLADSARVDVRGGRDVAVERQQAKRKPKDTIEALVAAYLEQHAHVHKRSAHEDERILHVEILPAWKGRAVSSITRRDVRDVLERIAKRGAPIMANRVLEVVRKMFNWGIRRDWLEANPAALLEKPGREVSRDRVLDDDEIRKLWRCLGRFRQTSEKRAPGRRQAPSDPADPFSPLSPALSAVQKLRLVTAQRGGEILAMQWGQLDVEAGLWTIPATIAKNGRLHVVPLTATALEIIRAQPKRKRKAGEPDFVFVGQYGAVPVARMRRAGAALSRVLGFDFRSHDLRRTAATRMVAVGVPREHVSRVLNHVPAGPVATRAYDRHDYLSEKRAALERWEAELLRLLSPERAS